LERHLLKPRRAPVDDLGGRTHTMAKHSTKNTFVGVEIEPSAVHAASVSVNGSVRLNAAGSRALETGIVRDGEVADVDALAEALRSLFADNKGLDKRVRLGIANQKIVVRVLDLPPLEDRKELDAAIRFQAQDEIPMPLDSAVLDFQPLGIVQTEAGARQRVLLVAARRDMIDRVLQAARAAGLRPEGIDLAAFGMVRALHRSAGGEGQVLYVSVGGLTNLAVAQGTTCLFTRVVGGGLESLAIELAERRGLTLEHSRAWVDHVGLAEPTDLIEGDREIVQDARTILLEGVRRIGGDVRNSLDFHHAAGGGAGAPGVERAVLTGASVAVPGFAEAMAAELGLPVDVGTVDGAPLGLHPGRVTVAAGLAMQEAPS
jgi:type IV pilus assembly protein PilM